MKFPFLLMVIGIAALLAEAPPAFAHGGIPRAYEILREPGNREHLIVRSDLWGFFRSVDGGESWQYYCAEVYSGRSTDAQNRSMVIAPGGRIFVAASFDGLFFTDDGCEWRSVPAFDEKVAQDVVLVGPPSEPILYVLTSTGDADGVIATEIWSSRDGGDTWTQVSSPSTSDLVAQTIAVAPSEKTRWYVSGKRHLTRRGTILRSDDAGQTWVDHDVPLDREEWANRIGGVHPTDPDILFVWADGYENLGEDDPDQIFASSDGGGTFREIFQGRGDLPGFALSPDGSELLIAGPRDGIQRANVTDALEAGPSAFAAIFDLPAWGLEWIDAEVLAGRDNYAARGIPSYTLGASNDQGATFSEEMSICDLEVPRCADGTVVKDICEPIWYGDSDAPGFHEEYVVPRCEPADEATPDPQSDVGLSPHPSSGGAGCACVLPAHHGSDNRALTAFGTALVWMAARRRRT